MTGKEAIERAAGRYAVEKVNESNTDDPSVMEIYRTIAVSDFKAGATWAFEQRAEKLEECATKYLACAEKFSAAAGRVLVAENKLRIATEALKSIAYTAEGNKIVGVSRNGSIAGYKKHLHIAQEAIAKIQASGGEGK